MEQRSVYAKKNKRLEQAPSGPARQGLESLIAALEARLALSEARIAVLEGKSPSRPAAPGEQDRRRLPVNRAAYAEAFEAWVNGHYKPMREYCRRYRVPLN